MLYCMWRFLNMAYCSNTEAYGTRAEKIADREDSIRTVEWNMRYDRNNPLFSREADEARIRQLKQEIEDLRR